MEMRQISRLELVGISRIACTVLPALAIMKNDVVVWTCFEWHRAQCGSVESRGVPLSGLSVVIESWVRLDLLLFSASSIQTLNSRLVDEVVHCQVGVFKR